MLRVMILYPDDELEKRIYNLPSFLPSGFYSAAVTPALYKKDGKGTAKC
jgi:hypothetical protein